MFVRVPVERVWPGVSTLAGAGLRVGQQDLSQHMLHGAGELQSQESRRSLQEALRALWTGVEERSKELHV